MKLCTNYIQFIERQKKLLFNTVEKKICLSVEKKTVPEEASSPPQGRWKKKLDSTLQYLHHQHYALFYYFVTNWLLILHNIPSTLACYPNLQFTSFDLYSTIFTYSSLVGLFFLFLFLFAMLQFLDFQSPIFSLLILRSTVLFTEKRKNVKKIQKKSTKNWVR